MARAESALDLDPLRVVPDGPDASGFRGVYLAGRGPRTAWHAKVKLGGRLVSVPDSRQATAERAARALVRFYRTLYGPAWADVVRGVADLPFDVHYERGKKAFRVTLWVQGAPVRVCQFKRAGKRRWVEGKRAAWCVKVEDAFALARRAAAEYGLFAEVLLVRSSIGRGHSVG